MGKIKWKTIQPSVGPVYYRGRIGITEIFIVSMALAGGGYMLRCALPDTESIKVINVEEAKKQAETILEIWIERSGLNFA